MHPREILYYMGGSKAGEERKKQPHKLNFKISDSSRSPLASFLIVSLLYDS